MTTKPETRIIPLYPAAEATPTAAEALLTPEEQEQQRQADDTWRRSIPAQVFLNYFFAINYHIEENDSPLGGLAQLPYFRQHQAELTDADVAALTKLLHACWSTEYALRATAELGDENFLRNALHWTFPQAYHTILSGLASLPLHHGGAQLTTQQVISREVGRLVVKNAYPRPVSFYAAGAYGDFSHSPAAAGRLQGRAAHCRPGN